MKKILIALLLLGVLGLTACSTTAQEDVQIEDVEEVTGEAIAVINPYDLVLSIEGMSCASCAIGVESQLANVYGVISAEVDIEGGIGYIHYDADQVDAATIVAASDVYPATIISDTAA